LSAFGARAEDDVLWTEKPIHVDPAKQHYERLPPLRTNIDTRIWINVPFKIEARDSARFSFDGKSFRLGRIVAVAGSRLCGTAEGGRWTCGRAGIAMLNFLVRGNRLLCQVSPSPSEIVLTDCVVGPRDITSEIVASGLARVDGDQDLKSVELLARRKREGLWRNPACMIDFDHC
jgi:endonuclease YncB( thermonuclease family)